MSRPRRRSELPPGPRQNSQEELAAPMCECDCGASAEPQGAARTAGGEGVVPWSFLVQNSGHSDARVPKSSREIPARPECCDGDSSGASGSFPTPWSVWQGLQGFPHTCVYSDPWPVHIPACPLGPELTMAPVCFW